MKYVFALIALLAFTAPVFAHEHADAHHAEDIYAPAMQAMHEKMAAVQPTGNADVDFINGMIPHHEGAVAMAKVLLEKTQDPEMKKLAADIIAAQEKEIAFMQAWLKAHPGQ